MKVKNLTNISQRLWIEDLLRGGATEVEILPGEIREIAKNYLPDSKCTPNFDKIFSIITPWKSEEAQSHEEVVKEEAPAEITPTTEEDEELEEEEDQEEEESQDEDQEETTPVNDSKFICEICGAEFGSTQGLSMHKTRSHPSLS